MNSATFTASQSSTYSEARARHVLGKVHDHLIALAMRQLLSMDIAQTWIDTLLYLMGEKAVSFFEIQCHLPKGQPRGWRHTVDDSGAVVTDDPSGGVDAYALPPETRISIVVRLQECRNLNAVLRELARRGWGDGQLLDGPVIHERTFSRSGYGLVRSRVGHWEEG